MSTKNLRLWYLVGCLVWLVAVTVYPPWIGVSYSQGFSQSGKVKKVGTFGLARSDAPLWRPPWRTASGPASLRWPWQPVVASECVELALGRLAVRGLLGVTVVGLVIGGIKRLVHGRQREPVVDFAWWLALGELVALLFLFLALMTPLAMAFNDLILLLFCVVGGVIGAVLFALDRCHTTHVVQASPGDSASNEEAVETCGTLTTAVRWWPRFHLSTLFLATSVLGLALGQMFGLPALHYTVFEQSLLALSLINLLTPFVLWWLPASFRWSLWTLVYLSIFVGAHHGIEYEQGALLAIGSGLGSAAGLAVNCIRFRFTTPLPRRPMPASYGWVVFGFLAGVICLVPTVPLLAILTIELRELFAPEWGMRRSYGYGVYGHGSAANMLLGSMYVVIALIGLRSWLIVQRVGCWKGAWFGVFVFATALGVLWFCFH